MTINDMIAWFETRGFKVTVACVKTGHMFKISKYDYHAVDVYAGGFCGEVSQLMFLDRLLNTWNRGYRHKQKQCEKKVILVGTLGLSEKFEFMHELMRDLTEHNITVYPINSTRFETKHTIVIFVWADRLYSRREEYTGIRADAFFSDHPELLDILSTYAEPYAVNNCHHSIGVFDYICKVEREASEYKKVYITSAGSQESELLKRMLNYTYGKYGDYRFGATIKNIYKVMEEENNMPNEAATYVRQDINSLAAAFKRVNDAFNRKLPGIKNVIFSGPCTIVIWEDKTKTVVRCNNDVLDPEKGLAMAIAKKALGTNKSGSNYYDIFKKWLPKPEENAEEVTE